MIDWSTIFEHAKPEPGASLVKTAKFVAELGLSMTRAEIERANADQRNPWSPSQPEYATWEPFDPGVWVMPKDRPVPPSYRSFVRYSDGGSFQNGDRLFQFWGTGLREFMLCYNTPQYMPLAVPFAFNGGGVMYMFDMREPPGAHGEYPIICAHAGHQTFDPHYTPRVANSFPEVCLGRFNIERLRFDGIVLTADQWLTCTNPKPMLDDCDDDRKLRLFACACARRVWHLLPDKLFREAVEFAERYADCKATDKKRKTMKEKCEALQKTPTWTPSTAAAGRQQTVSVHPRGRVRGTVRMAPQPPKPVRMKVRRGSRLVRSKRTCYAKSSATHCARCVSNRNGSRGTTARCP